MHINEFTDWNFNRCEQEEGFNHPVDSWSLSDWMVALTGEVGEAANILKKMNRLRDGMEVHRFHQPVNMEDLKAELINEIADIYIYLDLFAVAMGIDLETAIVNKFNATSRKIGYPRTLVLDMGMLDSRPGVPSV